MPCAGRAVLEPVLLSWQNGTKRGGQTSAVSEGAFITGDWELTSSSRKAKDERISHDLSERCDSAAAQCKQTDSRQTDNLCRCSPLGCVRPHRHGFRWVGRVRRSCGVFESRRDLARTHAFSKQQRQTKAAPVLPRWRANDVADPDTLVKVTVLVHVLASLR